MTAQTRTELDWLRSVRAGRDDLIHVPALPVRAALLPDDDGTYWCSGCGLAPDRREVFEDSDAWIWCQPCATSHEVGAAFTQSELIHLSGTLCSAVGRCERGAAVHRFADAEAGLRADLLAELRALRDIVTLAPVGTPAPVDLLFAGSAA